MFRNGPKQAQTQHLDASAQKPVSGEVEKPTNQIPQILSLSMQPNAILVQADLDTALMPETEKKERPQEAEPVLDGLLLQSDSKEVLLEPKIAQVKRMRVQSAAYGPRNEPGPRGGKNVFSNLQ